MSYEAVDIEWLLRYRRPSVDGMTLDEMDSALDDLDRKARILGLISRPKEQP